jgi:hypothetical protein
MKTFTDKEAMEWCKQWPLQLEFDTSGLLCAPTESHAYRVDISKMPWRENPRNLSPQVAHPKSSPFGLLKKDLSYPLKSFS